MNDNLIKSTAFGILWTGTSQISVQGFRFIVIIILARLLYPEDFGLVGLAAIFIGLINAINELGLSAAIIQKKNIEEVHLSTSFWASVATGIILFLFTILASPYVADFFNEDLVEPLLIINSIGFIIGSFSVVHRAQLEKNLKFKKISIVEIVAACCSGIISIAMAFAGYGVWSLILGGLFGNFISVILLWKIFSWRPSLIFSFTHFKELFNFGGNVMSSRILNYIESNIDFIIIGKMLSALAFGYYSFAYSLILFPLRKVSIIVTRVVFPAFSILQDDNEILRKGYLKIVRYISLITFPMLSGLFVVAPEFITIVYGTKWTPMILPLQILCLTGILHSIGHTIGTILLSKGRADIQLKWNLFSSIVLTIAVIIGVQYGIVGVAVAVTIAKVFLFPTIQLITNRLIDLSMFNYFKAIYPAIISSITLMIFVEVYQRLCLMVFDISGFYLLITSIFLGIIVYISVLSIFFNDIFKELKLLKNKMRG